MAKVKYKKYYIEFVHENSEAENYDMQSRFFDTKKEAMQWFKDSFDYVDDDENVLLMTAEFYENDSYDITDSKRIN